MDKTASNEQKQKKNKISAKRAEEIKVSGQIAAILKREWEELRKKQDQRGIKISASRKISSITLIKNRRGKISVQVNMQNGARMLDNAKEKNVVKFKEKAQKVYSRAKIEELLKKIKEYGYAAVEGEIPAELKEAVLKSMEKANISTSYKGAKAEAEAARQASQRAAEFANKALNASGLSPAVAPAVIPYSIIGTAAVLNAMNNGVKFEPPMIPDNISPSVLNTAKEVIENTLDIAAKSIGTRKVTNVQLPRMFSSAIRETETITRSDGSLANITIKGSALTSSSNSNKAQFLLSMLGADKKEYTPAMHQMYSTLEQMWQKEHPGEKCSKENLESSILNGEFINNISFKSLKQEFHQNPASCSPIFRDFMAKEKEAEDTRIRIENEQKMKQIKTVFNSNETELTLKGRKLKEYLAQNGITSEEQLKDPQNKAAVEGILKQNKFFIQKGGNYFSSSREADVQDYDRKREEFQKSPSLFQRLISKEIPSDGYTFEQIYQDARSHKKYLPQEIQDQKWILHRLQREKGLDKTAPISESMLKNVQSLYAEYQSNLEKDSSIGLESFLKEKGLLSKKEKQSTEERPSKQQAGTNNREAPSSLTEQARVISKIKENMEKHKVTVSETQQSAGKQVAVKTNGQQQKPQQHQQGIKPGVRQAPLSPAVQAALLKKKKEMSR